MKLTALRNMARIKNKQKNQTLTEKPTDRTSIRMSITASQDGKLQAQTPIKIQDGKNITTQSSPTKLQDTTTAEESINKAKVQTTQSSPQVQSKFRSSSACLARRNRDSTKIKGFAFETMLDQNYPKNVFIGSKPMRGFETNDNRFETFNPEP